ncbi:MAG: hypothetical protein RIQ60_634 [Pseudomonadota bacterium]|jgi:flagella basal body P-ring formation protein FlgA
MSHFLPEMRNPVATLLKRPRGQLTFAGSRLVFCLSAGLLALGAAQAQGLSGGHTGELPATLQIQVQRLAASQVNAPGGARVEVLTGTLDPRLKLAPCTTVEPYLPAGARAWGSTRVGLRCIAGAVHWNVYLPVTVKVWAPAVTAASALAAGSELTARDLVVSAVDIAAQPSPTFDRPETLLGRRLNAAQPPGVAIRADMLRVRQWFAAGDPVTLITRGEGFSVSSAGEALGPGLDGQSVRVRTEGGRVVVGLPVGERRVEVR